MRIQGGTPLIGLSAGNQSIDATVTYTGTAVAANGELVVPIVERFTLIEVGAYFYDATAGTIANPGTGFKFKVRRRMGGVRSSDTSTAFLPNVLTTQLVVNQAAVPTNINLPPQKMNQVTGELDLLLWNAPNAVPTGSPTVTYITTRAGAQPTTFAGFTPAPSNAFPVQVLAPSLSFAANGTTAGSRTSGSEVTNAGGNLLPGTMLRAYTEADFAKGDLLVFMVTAAGAATSRVMFYARGYQGAAELIAPADVDSN